MLKHLARPAGVYGLLLAVIIAMAGFTLVVALNNRQQRSRDERAAQANILEQRRSCIAAGERSVQQLWIDYVVYDADRRTADSSEATIEQRRIRGGEAAAILDRTKRLATQRLDVQFAGQLPKPIADVVRSTGFSCEKAFPSP